MNSKQPGPNRQFGLSRNIRRAILLTSMSGILLAAMAFALLEFRLYQNNIADSMTTITRVISANSLAAVAFEDPKAAAEVLSALSAEPDVDTATLFLADGSVLASYLAEGGAFQEVHQMSDWMKQYINWAPTELQTEYHSSTINLGTPLVLDEDPIGYLHVSGNMDALYHQMRTMGLFLLLIVSVLSLAGLFLAQRFQRRISRPFRELTESMAHVSEVGDYSLRMDDSSEGSIGNLVHGFNDMLHQVELRDAALEKSRDQLEDRVEERTADLKEAKEAAEAASLAKSSFLATMSHEIRTPMNGVLGMTEILLGSRLSERQKHLADTAYRSAESLLGVINNVLDFSKIEAGKLEISLEPFNLRRLLEDTADLLADRVFNKGIDFVSDLPPDLPAQVRGDSVRLRQILVNLLGNAVKFTTRGEIRLRARVLESTDGQSWFEFQVSDTGIGIKPETLPYIFEPFSQADSSTTRRFGGTGLGLSITRRLIELLHGEIEFESKPGQGTLVSFRLPMAVEQSTAEPTSIKELRNRRILIVDDHKTNRTIMHNQVLAWGMRDSVADSASSALHILREAALDEDPFQLVLLDWHLPDSDGLTLSNIIDKDPSIPRLTMLVLSSAGLDPVGRVDASSPISCFLSKPVRQQQLLTSLLDAINGKCNSIDRADAAETRENDPLPTLTGKILLAEDNVVNQEVALSMLSSIGCEADVVSNGQEAVASAQSAAYDLVLMDCHMPVLDGFDASRQIRNNERSDKTSQRIPVIALTADVRKGIVQQCADAGMDDYLSKPFTARALRGVLAQWLPATAKNVISSPGEAGSQPSATAPGNIHDILDQGQIEQLVAAGKATGRDTLGRVSGLYRADAPRLLEQMQAAVAATDAEALRSAAHSLKSASGNVGATELFEACRGAENAAREGDLQLAAEHTDHAGQLLPAVIAALLELTSEATAAATASVEAPEPAIAADAHRVLLVDDDASFRATSRDMLSSQGFKVELADSGQAALSMLRRNVPDIILLDAVMDGMDGFDTCERIRAIPQFSQVPILMITGLEDTESVEQAFESGATAFASKPVNYPQLYHRIKFILRSAAQEAEIREKQLQLETAQHMARLGYWRWDIDTDRFELSEKLAEMGGVSEGSFGGSLAAYIALVHPNDRSLVKANMEQALTSPSAVTLDFRIGPPQGPYLRVQQELGARAGSTGMSALIGTVQDVSRQRAAEDKIRKLAYFDSLTGLASRTYLMQRINERVRQTRVQPEPFSVLFIDLDGFKHVNDSLGHDMGDYLLSAIGQRMKTVLRDVDFLARLGGDEFCVLLDQGEDLINAAEAASRCLEAIHQPIELENTHLRPEASIGIAQFPEDATTTSELLKAADSAMYVAKQTGKHRYAFYHKEMTIEAEQRLATETRLRTALDKDQFELFYQPKVDLNNGRITGFEALARWRDPEMGVVSPDRFIHILERMGMISRLGSWAINEACQQAMKWRAQGLPPAQIAVNVSPYQLETSEIVNQVRDALAHSGMKPAWLELEITESAVQSNPDAIELIHALRNLGVSIAIDDFGTGYSSLGSLKQLPIDTLKIDRMFVKDILENTEDSVLLGTITGLAHALDYRVVCEGIEKLEQAMVLNGLGCDYGQGYFFSKPIEAASVPDMLLEFDSAASRASRKMAS